MRFVTGLEIGKDDRDLIDDLFQKEGWLLFCDMDETEIEIPKKKPDTGRKSDSEILYNRMYVAWKHRNIQTPFEMWRKSQLESIGQQYLSELN